jgi:hypothetical protein
LSKYNDDLLPEAANAKAMKGCPETYNSRYFLMSDPSDFERTIRRDTHAKTERQKSLKFDAEDFVASGGQTQRAFKSFYRLLAESVNFAALTQE